MTALLLWMGLALAGPEMIPEEDPSLVGRTAPAIELQTLDGEAFSLESHRGKVVVLAFWASWCGPCRLELPALDELQKSRSDMAVFAVNVDRQRSAAERFLRKVPVDLPIVWDNTATALGQYNVMSMPTVFVVDPQGTVKLTKVGYSREKRLVEIVAAIDEASP